MKTSDPNTLWVTLRVQSKVTSAATNTTRLVQTDRMFYSLTKQSYLFSYDAQEKPTKKV